MNTVPKLGWTKGSLYSYINIIIDMVAYLEFNVNVPKRRKHQRFIKLTWNKTMHNRKTTNISWTHWFCDLESEVAQAKFPWCSNSSCTRPDTWQWDGSRSKPCMCSASRCRWKTAHREFIIPERFPVHMIRFCIHLGRNNPIKMSFKKSKLND